jgi:hypothetical protein
MAESINANMARMKLAHESSRSVSPAHSPVPEKSVKSVDDKAKVLKLLRDNEQKHHDLEHAASITANLAKLEVMRANEQRIRDDQLHRARLLDQEHLVSVNANLIKMRQQNGLKESPQDRAHTNSLDAKLVDIRAQQTMIEPSLQVNNFLAKKCVHKCFSILSLAFFHSLIAAQTSWSSNSVKAISKLSFLENSSQV